MRCAYEYVALWFGLGVLGVMSLVWSLLAIPLHDVLPKSLANPLGRWAITVMCRAYLGILGLVGACRFDIQALDALRGEPPLVIAPNHPGLLDALLVMSRLSDLACIMKVDIVDNVFLGASARLAGYIRNDAPLSMIKQAIAELKNGSHLLLFPEGTRTTRWPVNACTPVAALIAGRARVPIQTVFIESDSAFLSKGWPLWRRPTLPITYRIRLGRRFAPPQQASELTAELERYFGDQLRNGSLPPAAGRRAQAASAGPGPS
ncbi:1-acyl-sn-glycerol-3-phosphate acyltransferase [uncultured Thiodictyon sp.]|jgi:1-acyl-sn-glycerol-3-phosphate acyltransferase|uniref:lysophospholipid acyltransferase family protein n=1 Tax=uncultured Thiodictyon sp. TaxID=1846217 RepID=UPI0025F75E22|nr:lysophospholipid acyltransferase family protein [uncultured Thiodictyon sp.]